MGIEINITLTNEQYELLLKGLKEAEASLDRQIEAIERWGEKVPTLEKHSSAFYKLRYDIEWQVKTLQ